MTNLKWSLLVGVFALLPACGGEADGFTSSSTAGAAGLGTGGASSAGRGNQNDCNPSAGGSAGGAQGGSAQGGSAQGGSAQGGGSTGPFMSSFPGATVVGNLSVSERDELCGEFNSSPIAHVVLNEVCLQTALSQTALQRPTSDAEAQTYCAIIYGACLQTPLDPPACGFDSGCQVTVAELEQCTNDGIAATQAAAAALPACVTLTRDALLRANLSGELANPASCAVVDQKCPAAGGGQQ